MVIKIVALLGIWASIFLSGCGLVGYPGQAGMATNGYSKIDMEFLDASGLWTYEVSYDNREGGAGVTAIISRLYPGALTYTSNSRSGPDGTHYRHKEPYQGSTVQRRRSGSRLRIICGGGGGCAVRHQGERHGGVRGRCTGRARLARGDNGRFANGHATRGEGGGGGSGGVDDRRNGCGFASDG